MSYFFSPALGTFLKLAEARMSRGQGAVLLLEGPPGGGKTAFAQALADHLDARLHYYAGAPDRERDLLYEVDVSGVLRRENAWVPGPAWQSFVESADGPSVLLIDEVDKTNPGFDAFLLRMLEDWAFRSPDGETIHADPAKLAVVLTSNGRRELRPEVLRRCQRVPMPLPDNGRLRDIVRQIAGDVELPDALLSILFRIADAVRRTDPELAPSPKELAHCACDLLELAVAGTQEEFLWKEVAASWLVKGGGVAKLDELVKNFRWARALRTEAQREE